MRILSRLIPLLGVSCVVHGFIAAIPTTTSRRQTGSPLHANVDDVVNRRDALLALGSLVSATPTLVSAAVTDETNAFANTDYDSSYRGLKSNQAASTAKQATAQASDEISFSVSKGDLSKGLGLELGQVEFRTSLRVYVKYVEPGSVADKLGVKKDWVIVSINGKTAERTNAEGVAILVYQASQSLKSDDDTIELSFRDPKAFQSQLRNLEEGQEVTTQVAPAGDSTKRNNNGTPKRGTQVTTQDDQRVSVSQLVAPKLCNKPAETDDLLEISYLGTVVETGNIFDGSAIRINGEGVPGRGNDVSLFFVLGKQPFGQFPPGWEVGIQGMCVGERRRVIIPPVLAYGSVGLPRRGIPPDATLQYDVTLVSINGLALPQ